MRNTLLYFVAQYCLTVWTQPDCADLDNPPSLEPVEDTIKQVFILARGGSRVPIFDPFPKDEAHWKQGKGELLEHGKRLMTALGRSLHSRYAEVIRRSESKARSLSCDRSPRANQSAACVAAELFRDAEYSVPDGEDGHGYDTSEMISQPDSQRCPRYTMERTRTHAWDLLHADVTVEDEDNDIYPRGVEIRELTGVQGPITRLDLMKIWDTLYMERVSLKQETGQDAPAWAEELMRWKDMSGETMDFVTGGDYYLTEDYTVGPFFNHLFRQFSTPGVSFSLHVSHSLFLTAVLSTLGLHMYKPHLGTALIFELHDEDLVRVLLYQPLDWDNPGEFHQAKGRNPMVTALQGVCHDWDFNAFLTPYTCPLVKFQAKLPSLSRQEWTERCSRVK